MNGLITLTTDFGTQDGFVGAMKGVIFSENAEARVVDLTHDVPPQDVHAGAFALAQAAAFFPPRTVHVAVVDPGVGTARRALCVEHRGSLFVGPDNGLLSLAAPFDGSVAFVLDRMPSDWSIHPTFHGRDLFARIAARLAAGAAPADFSTGRCAPEKLQAISIETPACEREGGDWVGQVIHVDRFGNLVTNLVGDGVEAVEIGGRRAARVTTYADVERGRLLAYLGSAGYLEVAVRDGSAAALLSVGRGASALGRVRQRRGGAV